MKKSVTLFLLGFICFFFWVASPAFAQTESEGTVDVLNTMKVQRIGIADLNGILRAAEANIKVRELLEGQREKFQNEFNKVEAELQQTERDLMSKRDLLSADEYNKQINSFQKRVTLLQKNIQTKRQSLDNAYQKAQSDIRAKAIAITTEIATEMRLDLVLNRDSSLIFLPHLNISDEVLERLNEQTKNARVEIELQEPQS